MNSSGDPRLPSRGPTADDCFRLYRTLQREYIPGLRIELSWYEFGEGLHGMKVEAIDDSAVTFDGIHYVNIWAAKTFGNQLHLISEAQLYDLLIVAYRQIEKFFEQGEAFAPARRAK
jgi:hypothetical protein